MSHAGMLPTTQGPFLVQPETSTLLESANSIVFIDEDLLVVGFEGGTVEICLVDRPAPKWRSIELGHLPSMTVIESLRFDSKLKNLFMIDGKRILVQTANEAYVVTAPFLQNDSVSLKSRVEPVFGLSEDQSLLLKYSIPAVWNGSLWVVGVAVKREKLGMDQSFLIVKELTTTSLSSVSLLADQLESLLLFAPEPLIQKDANQPPITFDRLELDPKLRNLKFPQDFDESALEALINITSSSRLSTITRCIILADQISLKSKSLQSCIDRQFTWSKELESTSIKQAHHFDELLQKLTLVQQRNTLLLSRIKGLVDRKDHNASKNIERLGKVLRDSLEKIGEMSKLLDYNVSNYGSVERDRESIIQAQLRLQSELLNRLKLHLRK